MIDTASPRQRAFVLLPVPPKADFDADARLEEAAGLAEALDLHVLRAETTPLRAIDPGSYFGSGKLADFAAEMNADEISVCVVDTALSPVQQRNLEKAWKVKVIDRTGLILEIFGRRARTREGRLQVELARLAYERSRLVRTWTHLERQRGGGGFLAGPGETQIETDRRLLADKMAKLRKELDQVRRTRALHRKNRRDAPYPMVALVGYTNAGKSTLFNTITGAGVFAKDMPFATLDTTVRGFETPSGVKALMSDTVGFITDLPTELVAAFRATLEEVREADILVHVLDASAPDLTMRRREVEEILESLEAGSEHGQPVVEAFNKFDLIPDDADPDFPLPDREKFARVMTSAVTGEGVERLLATIDKALAQTASTLVVRAGTGDAEAVAWLHRNGAVLDERSDTKTGETTLVVRLSPEDAGRFPSQFPGVHAHLRD
ncbi:GTPase HflX [Hyphobacterium marinum]|uniref:GTPase HflX n=1 Tax=Hyphobacterium marinum TaxID=3116574 RepID=A0ABU7LYF3_9PROT|nr:GTPase HflX [Hyphobacterium sp. Y6023]MEE2566592.1 GTPase HflX [Hyphobacterium sp. Y6023]